MPNSVALTFSGVVPIMGLILPEMGPFAKDFFRVVTDVESEGSFRACDVRLSVIVSGYLTEGVSSRRCLILLKGCALIEAIGRIARRPYSAA